MNLNLIMYSAFALSALLGLGSITALNAAPQSATALSEEPTQGSIRVSKDEDQANLAKRAVLSAAQAEQAVAGKTPGKVIETEREVENRFLVWEVKSVADDGTTTELYVDAGNGEIVAMEQEHDDDDDDDDAGVEVENEQGKNEDGEDD
ncbi:MAG: PepSY domain-containing protein [Gammaproteobacteria bacterium]|nr:PepSY domain-containing protein [Gammaproteobacteria bacterium]